jgi:hypothetical protein
LGSGNAAEVFFGLCFPAGIDFISATAIYSMELDAFRLFNTNTIANNPLVEALLLL